MQSTEYYTFIGLVKEKLNDGWKLQGGVNTNFSHGGIRYYQAVYK